MRYDRGHRAGPMDNLQAVRHLFWIVAAIAALPVLGMVITSVLLQISRPSQNPPTTGLRGIFYSEGGLPRSFWSPSLAEFWDLHPYSLNFANPWAWVYLVVVVLLHLAPLFFAFVLISHLLANLTN